MDSVTQVLLGSAVAATIAPKSIRKRAIVVGAVLGTLPDLDVLVHYINDVDSFTKHRSFSHSLLLLPLYSIILLPLLRRVFSIMSLRRLYCLIVLSLITHPLLDSFTSYGTQLFYPFDFTPTFIASVLVIDPLYSVWLLIGIVLYLYSPKWRWANTTGLIISTMYLGIGVGAQTIAHQQLTKAYPQTQPEKWFVGALTASPLCWRGVYRYDDFYIETAFNVLDPKNIAERRYNILPDSSVALHTDWQRLRWFNPDTVIRQRGGSIITSDLRMGEFGHYAFEFTIDPTTKQPSKQLSMYDKPLWQPISYNDNALSYDKANNEQSIPLRKWKQFTRCLGGGM
ncbi:MAG: metal-dependent hydrolase [Gammaproteobacteria bacterium]|nr:metal-dependent hydrolase [Gammaproteobacteria bacterium]